MVDDAIIDVENILRRLRQNALLPNPQPKLKVVLDASLEVRSAVVYASVIIVLVFVPVFFLPGLAGTFFRPLALSYILAITASLAVALTLTPALSLILLKVKPGEHRDALLSRGMKAAYRGILPVFAKRPWAAMGFLALAFLGTGWIWKTQLKEEFLPSFKERDFLMHWLEKPNTSVEASKRITIAAATDLLKVPGVRNQGAHIGRARSPTRSSDRTSPNSGSVSIRRHPTTKRSGKCRRSSTVIPDSPAICSPSCGNASRRCSPGQCQRGRPHLRPDLEQLRTHATEVGDALKDIPGVSA